MKLEHTYVELMNHYGKSKIPFIFLIDFAMKAPIIVRSDEAEERGILFDIDGITNTSSAKIPPVHIQLKKYPVSFSEYQEQFRKVLHHIQSGNSYLVNLTCPTRIELNCTLRDVFFLSRAKYKLLVEDRFVVFSPESFVRIHNGIISSYPMKGTIDAAIINAEQEILNSPKEQQEHTTIVDLIRNDLSIVAKRVRVKRFRYIERIRTHEKELLQVSSEITGQLPANYRSAIGTILTPLLPAGSVTGAPKKKTVEIINEIEGYDRGYYTGVMGYFDGETLDSGVMIRFIENIHGTLYYKSGGGITYLSNPKEEYKEMIDKVYVPIV